MVSDSPSASESFSDHPTVQYVQQNAYDQRLIAVDQRQLHVGIDPQVMSQASAIVHAAREQVHQIQSQASAEVNASSASYCSSS